MPEPTTRTNASGGILVDGEPIPLLGVRVEAVIRDFATRVTLTQRYVNREPHPVDAVYVFPLDETAAVSGFAAIVGGVEVVGAVQEKEEAFETYDEALLDGHGAYLLDQERPDVFTASLGNLPPNQEVLLKLTYVTELTIEDDQLRFVLPTTVSPRYAPEEDRLGVGRSEAEASSPPTSWTVPYGIQVEVSVEMASPIRSLESPSHPIAMELDGAAATVRLGERVATMDRDFVLLIRFAESAEPRAWVETDDPDHDEGGGRRRGESVAMVAFQPKLETERAPSEILFILDRSGSMMGTSITEARNALQLCLRSLTPDTWFNVVGFGTDFEMLFPESVRYDESSLARATEYVRGIEANLGGTAILPALKAVLSQPLRDGLPRQIFLLTDGEVTNTEAVIQATRKHAGTTRVFTFGIGAGASHHLVRGLARAGEGACEMIYPGERIEPKVLRQLAKALAPALTDVRIDWGRLRVKQAPFRLPPVFDGGRLLVYGFLGETDPGTSLSEPQVTLHARSAGAEVSFRVPIPFGRRRKGTLIASLAARTLLRDLEEGASTFHERGSLQSRGAHDRVKEEAIRLGVRYGLASRWTSLVAVEKRERPVAGQPELRRIPVALTRGWGGLDRERGLRPMDGATMNYGMSAPSAATQEDSFSCFAPEASFEPDDSFAGALSTGSPARPERRFDRLALLQRADGTWDLTDGFASAIGEALSDLERAFPRHTGEEFEARSAWATALAVAWLRRAAADARDEWILIEKKARGWLARCGASTSDGQSWLAASERYFE